MANEVYVHEMQALPANYPVRPVPFVAQQILSIAGAASSGFNRSTVAITVISTTDCNIEVGANPTGVTNKFKIEANTPYDFLVRAGHKIIAVA